jgi:hypothetical protein
MTSGGGKKGSTTAPETTTATSPVVPAFADGFDKNQVLVELRQLSKDIATLNTKVERLIQDDQTTRGHVDGLRHQMTWAKGFGVAALLLIPACAAIVWWLIGGELTQIRDRLYSLPTAQIETAQPPAAGTAP